MCVFCQWVNDSCLECLMKEKVCSVSVTRMCWRTKTKVRRNVFVLFLPLVSKVIVCLLWSKKPIFALMSRTQCSCTKDCDCWSRIHFCTAQSCTVKFRFLLLCSASYLFTALSTIQCVCVTVCVCLLDIVVQKLLGCQAAQRCCQSVAGLKGNHVVFFFFFMPCAADTPEAAETRPQCLSTSWQLCFTAAFHCIWD